MIKRILLFVCCILLGICKYTDTTKAATLKEYTDQSGYERYQSDHSHFEKISPQSTKEPNKQKTPNPIFNTYKPRATKTSTIHPATSRPTHKKKNTVMKASPTPTPKPTVSAKPKTSALPTATPKPDILGFDDIKASTYWGAACVGIKKEFCIDKQQNERDKNVYNLISSYASSTDLPNNDLSNALDDCMFNANALFDISTYLNDATIDIPYLLQNHQ